MGKRAVLYPRVSTDEQAETGYSLPTQLKACRKYAQDNGFEVVGEFCDDYTGTVPIEDRPEGSKAYAMLASGEADALIAYRVDRIVRPPEEGDEWDMPILIRGLAKVGKELHVCDRGHLGTSFADLLLAMLDAKSAGDERRKFIERSVRGKREKARNGKPYSGGHVPYGFQVVRDEKTGKGAYFEIKESEAEVVRLIFEWFTQGNGDGKPMGIAAITRKLREMGIATPGETQRYRKRRKAEPGEWGDWIITRMLADEKYIGRYHFGPDDIPVEIPAIVSRDVWKQAQEQKARNKRFSRRNTKRKYLLRGMVHCGCGCGLTMTGTFSGRCGTRYYASRPRVNQARCKRRELPYGQSQVRADVLEHGAWEYLLSIMTNDGEFETRLREAQTLEQEAKEPKRERLGLVLEMIGEAEGEADKLARALAGSPGGIVEESLRRQTADVNARYAKLCRERDRLKGEIEAEGLTDQDVEDALKFQKAVKVGLLNPTWEDRRYYLETLRFEATIGTDGTGKFTCYLDVAGCVFDLHSRTQAQFKPPCWIRFARVFSLDDLATAFFANVRQPALAA